MCDGCGFSRTRQIDILGKKVMVKNYICSLNGEPYRKKPDDIKLQLSITPTEECGCGCSFCAARCSMQGRRIDTAKLERVLKELAGKKLIRGISITGGEPFSDVTLLNEVIEMCFDICGEDAELSINTNGNGLDKLDRIERLPLVESIHISRHHYLDDVNAELFHGKVPTGDEIKETVSGIAFKDIFVFNCLLLKDYIGSREEAYKFMDFAIEVGVPKTGFITAMEVNDFTRKQRVSFEDIITEDDRQLVFTKSYRDFDSCRCRDGVYSSPKGGIEEFYGRQTLPGNPGYVRTLVYGADNHLRTGFLGEVIA